MMDRFSYLLILILVLTFVVYLPGLDGGFIYDDFPNIVSNNSINTDSFSIDDLGNVITSGGSGPLKRPVSMLTFYLNNLIAGNSPYYYKLVNLIIHLFNGTLLYVFCGLLLQANNRKIKKQLDPGTIRKISIILSSVWLLHPINLSSVLYIVQRMNELSAMFALLAMITYLKTRMSAAGSRGLFFIKIIAFAVLILFAACSKENGVLIIAAAFLMEILFFGFDDEDSRKIKILHLFYVLFLYVPISIFIYLCIFSPGVFFDSYRKFDFNMYTRLITESRVIFLYVSLMLVPVANRFSLYRDDIMVSGSLIDPVTTLISIFAICLFIYYAFTQRKKQPLISFCILFFLTGHSLESSVFPLTLVFEYRNYLPSTGVYLLCIYLLSVAELQLAVRRFVTTTFLIFTVNCAFNTGVRAIEWGDQENFIFYELYNNPRSAVINYEVGRRFAVAMDDRSVLNKEMFDNAEYYFRRSKELDPDNISALIALIVLESSHSRVVGNEAYSQLGKYLEQGNLSIMEILAFIGLLECFDENKCIIDTVTVENLKNSIRKNSNIYGMDRDTLEKYL